MYTLRVRDHFDAAHFLPWHEGKCKNLHGHRWEVEVTIQSESLNKDGIVIDFGVVKNIIRQVIPDHIPLNIREYMFDLFSEFPAHSFRTLVKEFDDWIVNPTAERIANELFMRVQDELLGIPGVFLKEVTVWESPNCSITYNPDKENRDNESP